MVDFAKRLILVFISSFNIFCYSDDEEDEDDDDIKDRKIVFISKYINNEDTEDYDESKEIGFLKKSDIYLSLNVLNVPSFIEIGHFNSISQDDVYTLLYYLDPVLSFEYKIKDNLGLAIKFGVNKRLQTLINRYMLKLCTTVNYYKYLGKNITLNREGGLGFCFNELYRFSLKNIGPNGLWEYNHIQDYFDTTIENILLSLYGGLEYKFISLHIGGDVSLTKMLSYRLNKDVDDKYKELLYTFENNKISSYIYDLLCLEFRFHFFKFSTYFLRK